LGIKGLVVVVVVDSQEEILEAERAFKVKYFFVMVDVAITSLKNRFEELMVSKDLFGFLLSSNTLKSLNDSELEVCCTKFANTFPHDGSSDVEVHDLVSELKILKCTLPNDTLSTMESILEMWIVILTLPLPIESYLMCLLLLHLLKEAFQN
jgi:hypothetical protein